MAANSSNAKSLCLAIVSAILVVVADKEKPLLIWVAVVPIVMFMSVDAYYLGLERGFRQSYNRFIDELHSGACHYSSLYAVELTGQVGVLTFGAMGSFSVWPFYGTLLALLALTRALVV
jgi:hypothetical protein